MQPSQLTRGMFVFALSCLWTLVSNGYASADHANVSTALNLIPADAPIAIVVPNLATLSTKIAEFNEDSLDSMIPQLFDVLGTAKLMGGAIHGVDDTGTLVAFITSFEGIDEEGQPSEPPYLVLAPVSDYAAFVGNFGGDPNAPITPITLLGGVAGFAKHVEGHAVISTQQTLVEAYQRPNAIAAIARQAGVVGRECFSKSDTFVVINVDMIEPILTSGLQAMFAELDHAFNEENQQPIDPSFQELAEIYLRMYLDGLNALIRDTSMAIAGFDINQEGIGLTLAAQLQPESSLGELITTGGGASTQLAKLPNQPYMCATATDTSGVNVPLLLKKLLDRIPDNDSNKHIALVKEWIRVGMNLKGMAIAYLVPKQNQDDPMPMTPNGLVHAVSVFETADGNGPDYLATLKNLVKDLDGLEFDLGPAATDGDEPDDVQSKMIIKAQYTSNVMQIDGVQVDGYQIQYDFPPEMMEEMQQMGPLAMMMGGFGYNGYAAAKGSHVIMTTTPNAEAMELALTSVSQGDGLGTDGPIHNVRSVSLLTDPSYEVYVNVPGIMSMGNMFLGMMGLEPIDADPNLPPVALAKRIKEHGVAGRLFVPIDVIRFGKDVFDQMNAMNGSDHDGQEFEEPADQPDRVGPPPAPF